MQDNELVSVIMPTYNCGKFIAESIESVLGQTWHNLELIIVDDCSNDGTADIVRPYAEKDSRVRYEMLEKNLGPAGARNKAIELASGQYLAFNDSDDLWLPEKLEKQIGWMRENGYAFTCTSYEKIGENGENLRVRVEPRKKITYKSNLYLGNAIGNSTVVFDAGKLGKYYAPLIRKRNDFAMWQQILRDEKYCYGLKEPLGKYRVRRGSVSSGKLNLFSHNWNLYRNVEKQNIFVSSLAMLTLIVEKTLKSHQHKF